MKFIILIALYTLAFLFKSGPISLFLMTGPLLERIGKGLVINYGKGGLQNREIAGTKNFATPSRQGKTFCPPPLL